MTIVWTDNLCDFVIDDDVPGGKIKQNKFYWSVADAVAGVTLEEMNVAKNKDTGKDECQLVFSAEPDATDKTAVEGVITGTPYVPERPWSSTRKILKRVFDLATDQAQKDRILEGIDDRPSWVTALDTALYTEALAILAELVSKNTLEQEDYDLIESNLPAAE